MFAEGVEWDKKRGLRKETKPKTKPNMGFVFVLGSWGWMQGREKKTNECVECSEEEKVRQGRAGTRACGAQVGIVVEQTKKEKSR